MTLMCRAAVVLRRSLQCDAIPQGGANHSNRITRIVLCNRVHEIGITSNRVVVRRGENLTRNVLITRQFWREACY